MPDCWFSILLDINLWLFWPRSDLAKSYSSRGRSPRFWFVVLPDVPGHPCEHVLVPVDHIGHTVLVKADLLCILRVQNFFFTCFSELDAGCHTPPRLDPTLKHPLSRISPSKTFALLHATATISPFLLAGRG